MIYIIALSTIILTITNILGWICLLSILKDADSKKEEQNPPEGGGFRAFGGYDFF